MLERFMAGKKASNNNFKICLSHTCIIIDFHNGIMELPSIGEERLEMMNFRWS